MGNWQKKTLKVGLYHRQGLDFLCNLPPESVQSNRNSLFDAPVNWKETNGKNAF